MRCDSAMVVSSGLPIVFVSSPLPASRPLGSSSRVPSGCMNTSTPSSSHFAQNGWNFGSASSCPATLPATPTPRKPSCLTACSTCSAARSGYCSAAVAKATKRSGWLAQNCTSCSLHPDQLGGGVTLGAVPERVDAERLDIDTGTVHLGQPVADISPQQTGRFERVIDNLGRIGNDAMRMHIDGLDALAGDHDFPARLMMGAPAMPPGLPLGVSLCVSLGMTAAPTGAGAGSGAHQS